MISIFEGQPPKTRPYHAFSNQNKGHLGSSSSSKRGPPFKMRTKLPSSAYYGGIYFRPFIGDP